MHFFIETVLSKDRNGIGFIQIRMDVLQTTFTLSRLPLWRAHGPSWLPKALKFFEGADHAALTEIIETSSLRIHKKKVLIKLKKDLRQRFEYGTYRISCISRIHPSSGRAPDPLRRF